MLFFFSLSALIGRANTLRTAHGGSASPYVRMHAPILNQLRTGEKTERKTPVPSAAPKMAPQKLRDLIRAIRESKTAADERDIVQKECAAVRGAPSPVSPLNYNMHRPT